MDRQPTHTALENRFAADSRSFAAERHLVEDGYGGTLFDGYSVTITTDGVGAAPVLIPIYKIRSYDKLVSSMESQMDSVDSLPPEEQQHYMNKYNYYKDLRDALEGE